MSNKTSHLHPSLRKRAPRVSQPRPPAEPPERPAPAVPSGEPQTFTGTTEIPDQTRGELRLMLAVHNVAEHFEADAEDVRVALAAALELVADARRTGDTLLAVSKRNPNAGRYLREYVVALAQMLVAEDALEDGVPAEPPPPPDEAAAKAALVPTPGDEPPQEPPQQAG